MRRARGGKNIELAKFEHIFAKKVFCNSKEKTRQRISLSDTPGAFKKPKWRTVIDSNPKRNRKPTNNKKPNNNRKQVILLTKVVFKLVFVFCYLKFKIHLIC